MFSTGHISGYLIEPNSDNEDFKEAVRNVKKDLKWPKRTNKKNLVVFKRYNSLNTHFSMQRAKFRVVLTCHISGYLMKPKRENEDLNGAVRSVKRGKK